MRRRVTMLCLSLWAACGADMRTLDSAVDECATKTPTITEGIYGVIRQECGDLGGPCPGQPDVGQHVYVYDASGSGGGSQTSATASTFTDSGGFYQLMVDGTVDICVGITPNCIDGILVTGIARWDYIDFDASGRRWHMRTCM